MTTWLRLPNDLEPQGARFESLLMNTPAGRVVAALARALPLLARRLALGQLCGDPAAIVGQNESGDAQKALDVAAHALFVRALTGVNVRYLISEEAAEPQLLDPKGQFDVALDPVDGSGSIGIGAPLGTIFAVFPAAPDGFRPDGRKLAAAGYALIGHSLDLVVTLGEGVSHATWDASVSGFRLVKDHLTLPASSTLAWNAANEPHWPKGLQRYITDVKLGRHGPRGKTFNMRWFGAAVGDLHRIMLQGGLFLYPADARKGYESGRLRLIYEAMPIAFLIEQAGGRASDGQQDILDLTPTSLHQTTPLIFGDRDEVATLLTYL